MRGWGSGAGEKKEGARSRKKKNSALQAVCALISEIKTVNYEL